MSPQTSRSDPVGSVGAVGTSAEVSELRPRNTAAVGLRQLLERSGTDFTISSIDPETPQDPGTPDDQDATVTVSGAASDSRLVSSGDLYLALPGQHTHGAAYARAALQAGASAVLTDEVGRRIIVEQGLADRLPVAVLADPRGVMAELAADLYHRPAQAMVMLGVTGTNGKTTTCSLIDAGLSAAGRHAGLIGTLGFSYDGRALDGLRTTITTPESAELQGLLAALAERGADAVTMEVSSHALTLGRADAIRFDVAGFTNFGRDHLDFHGSEEAYFAAKASLFTAARTRAAVINVDDPRGPELVAQARHEGIEVATTGLGEHDRQADYLALAIEPRPDGSRVAVRTPAGELEIELGLPGRYNVHNAITALAMLAMSSLLGTNEIDLDTAARGFAAVAVPGRMQRVPLPGVAPRVFVDFAHTPQAVTAALAALAPLVGSTSSGRLICVVGCGGDRDPDKRAPMGAAAARGVSDQDDGAVRPGILVVTDDNPRTEDPAVIREATLTGAETAIRADRLPTELIDGGDRGQALRTALSIAAQSARPQDQVIAVLGKGHEHGQEIDGQIWPFDDVQVVAELWSELTAGSGASP